MTGRRLSDQEFLSVLAAPRPGWDLDEEGRRELAAAGLRWLAEAGDIQQRAADRAGDDAGRLNDVGVVLLIFEAVAFSDRSDG